MYVFVPLRVMVSSGALRGVRTPLEPRPPKGGKDARRFMPRNGIWVHLATIKRRRCKESSNRLLTFADRRRFLTQLTSAAFYTCKSNARAHITANLLLQTLFAALCRNVVPGTDECCPVI